MKVEKEPSFLEVGWWEVVVIHSPGGNKTRLLQTHFQNYAVVSKINACFLKENQHLKITVLLD